MITSLARLALTMAAIDIAAQIGASNTISNPPRINNEIRNDPEDPRVAGYRAERLERKRLNFLKRNAGQKSSAICRHLGE